VALLAALATFCLEVIRAMGLVGVFVLMVAESMVLPVPSEAVLPFAGFLAAPNASRLLVTWLVAAAGTLVGSLLSYWIGWVGLRPALERWGKFVLVSPHHLDLAHRFFEARSATLAVFLSRFVPVVRHLVSIPAGSARMPLWHFVVATVLGGAAWDLALLVVGYQLGEHWDEVTTWLDRYQWLVLGVAVVVAVAAFVGWRWRARARRPRVASAPVLDGDDLDDLHR
jgi:membrane protein DedA with SNARE-associated domain